MYNSLRRVMEEENAIYGLLGAYERYVYANVEGNPITLTDTKGNTFVKDVEQLNIYGWSKQETTTGAQLFDKREAKAGYFQQYNLDQGILSIVKSTAHWITGYIALEAGKTYTTNIPNPVGVFYDKDKQPITTEILYNKTTFTTPENTAYLVMTFEESVYSISNIEIIMLNEGTTLKAYEKYTGGKPSPSPDYPQEIVSAGSDGKIGIEVRGKNLLNFEEFLKAKEVVYTKESESYQITNIMHAYKSPYKFSDEDIEITISGIVDDITSKVARIDALNSSKKVVASITTGRGFVKCKASYIRLNYKERGIFNIQKVQIERGVTATAYEPYHEPQSLSIQTPTGLPAIPVDTGGNYTDADGQQWVADYIDLKRGKYVQRVWCKECNGSERWLVQQTKNIAFYLSNVLPFKDNYREGYSNKYKVTKLTSGGINFGRGNSALVIGFPNEYDDSLEDRGISNFKAHLAEHPLVVMTYLDEPIERDLTPEEIQTYQNLVTYAGTTILNNDANAHMNCTYRRYY